MVSLFDLPTYSTNFILENLVNSKYSSVINYDSFPLQLKNSYLPKNERKSTTQFFSTTHIQFIELDRII